MIQYMQCIDCIHDSADVKPGSYVVIEIRNFDPEEKLPHGWTGGVWHIECAQRQGVPR